MGLWTALFVLCIVWVWYLQSPFEVRIVRRVPPTCATVVSSVVITMPLARLPCELQWRILRHAVHASSAKQAHVGLSSLLRLSQATRRALLPQAYHTLWITTPKALNGLRYTLATIHPELGSYIRALHIRSCGSAPPLALEQVLVSAMHITYFSFDDASMRLLCDSHVGRLQHIAKPHVLCWIWYTTPTTRMLYYADKLQQFPLWDHVHTLEISAHPALVPVLCRPTPWPALKHVYWYAPPLALDTPWWSDQRRTMHHLQAWRDRGVHIHID